MSAVKRSISHAEAASGALVSLVKVLLMFQHGKIFAQSSLKNLDASIEMLENKFARVNIPRKPINWNPNADGRRIALVNSFGAAGSNAAMLWLIREPMTKCELPYLCMARWRFFVFMIFIYRQQWAQISLTSDMQRRRDASFGLHGAWLLLLILNRGETFDDTSILVPASQDTSMKIVLFCGQGVNTPAWTVSSIKFCRSSTKLQWENAT